VTKASWEGLAVGLLFSIAGLSAVGLLMIAAVATGWLTWSLGTFLIVLGLSVLGWMSWLTRRRRG